MIFADDIKPRYREAIETAAAVILEKGNKQQRNVARKALQTDLLIRFVPLEQIKVSGITGIIDNRRTNRRIRRETLSVEEAMGEVHITFSDWCVDVAGQRACQGTLVHEGLHAFDFARMISAYSKTDEDNAAENPYDLTLYELEHRAALISGNYLARVGLPEFIDDGLKLGLVRLDEAGRPLTDREGILNRMKKAYGLDRDNQGARISKILGIRPAETGFSLSRILGFNAL